MDADSCHFLLLVGDIDADCWPHCDCKTSSDTCVHVVVDIHYIFLDVLFTCTPIIDRVFMFKWCLCGPVN